MLTYSDADVFNRVQRGVDPRIVAELNGCSVKDVLQACERYKKVHDKEQKDYTKWLKSFRAAQRRTLEESQPVETREKRRQQPYKYVYEQENYIRSELKRGTAISDIYNRMFLGNCNRVPSEKAFYSKCVRIKKKLGLK